MDFFKLNKSIVCFQGFELVGIGVFTAGVSKDAGKPSTLFFDGEELGVTGRQVHSGGRMGFQASRHKRFPSGRVCCNDTHRQHHSCTLRSCRTSGKCQGFLYCSFSGVIFCWREGFKGLHDALRIDAGLIQRAQGSFVIVVVTCKSGHLSIAYQSFGISHNISEIAPVFEGDYLLPTFGRIWLTIGFVVHGWVISLGLILSMIWTDGTM